MTMNGLILLKGSPRVEGQNILRNTKTEVSSLQSPADLSSQKSAFTIKWSIGKLNTLFFLPGPITP